MTVNVLARVYLVRHGETDANREHIIQGQMDTPLNDRGVQQAKTVARALRSMPFDTAYSSDLSRASKTAELILKHHPDVRLERHQELRERYMGDLQGQAVKPKMRSEASANDTVETAASFSKRTVSWWDKTILGDIAFRHPKDEPYNILVTAHGGVIGTMVRNLIQGGRLKCAPGVVILSCANTSVTIIEVHDSLSGIITKYGDVSHMREGDSELETNADEVGN